MPEHTTLSYLTDEELLRHVDNERDPLTTTVAEIELAKRFAELMSNPPLPKKLQDAIDKTDNFLDEDDLPEIVRVLDEFRANDPKTLREKLKRANDFYDIATDAGDVIERLSTLVSKTL